MSKRPEEEILGDENKHDDKGIGEGVLIWMETAVRTRIPSAGPALIS
jgi:hypothetical protein